MNKKGKTNDRERTFLLITIPVLVLFFCFNTLPLIKGFIYSFTNFKGYGTYDFVGLRNYKDLFTDARVGRSYLFTFKYAIVCTIIVNVISLLLALGLNAKIKGKTVLRGIYFIPNILGGLVIGYIFSFFFTYILPAAGQAILAVESRNGDLREVLNAIHDKCAWVELCAERAFLKAIGGSCNAPAAGLAHLDENGRLVED